MILVGFRERGYGWVLGYGSDRVSVQDWVEFRVNVRVGFLKIQNTFQHLPPLEIIPQPSSHNSTSSRNPTLGPVPKVNPNPNPDPDPNPYPKIRPLIPKLDPKTNTATQPWYQNLISTLVSKPNLNPSLKTWPRLPSWNQTLTSGLVQRVDPKPNLESRPRPSYDPYVEILPWPWYWKSSLTPTPSWHITLTSILKLNLGSCSETQHWSSNTTPVLISKLYHGPV